MFITAVCFLFLIKDRVSWLGACATEATTFIIQFHCLLKNPKRADLYVFNYLFSVHNKPSRPNILDTQIKFMYVCMNDSREICF